MNYLNTTLFHLGSPIEFDHPKGCRFRDYPKSQLWYDVNYIGL
jgi:hypothetical protein